MDLTKSMTQEMSRTMDRIGDHENILPAVTFINGSLVQNPDLNTLFREPYMDRIFAANVVPGFMNRIANRDVYTEDMIYGMLKGPANVDSIFCFIKMNMRDLIIQALLSFLDEVGASDEYTHINIFDAFLKNHPEFGIKEIDKFIDYYLSLVTLPLRTVIISAETIEQINDISQYAFVVLDACSNEIINGTIELFDKVIETIVIDTQSLIGLDGLYSDYTARYTEIDPDPTDVTFETQYTVCTTILREVAMKYISTLTTAKTSVVTNAANMIANVVLELENNKREINNEQCYIEQGPTPELTEFNGLPYDSERFIEKAISRGRLNRKG